MVCSLSVRPAARRWAPADLYTHRGYVYASGLAAAGRGDRGGAPVGIRVRRLVRGRPGEHCHEPRIIDQRRRVDTRWRRGEEREQVEVAVPGERVHDPGAAAAFEIQHEGEPV